jgi:hypothetical protein
MLNDTIALEHERVEFKIKVLGTPKPSVQWYKDDMEVRSRKPIKIAENTHIKIHNVQIEQCLQRLLLIYKGRQTSELIFVINYH